MIDSFAGRGEPKINCFAHGSSPSASSKPEFRLPMMKTRLPANSIAGFIST